MRELIQSIILLGLAWYAWHHGPKPAAVLCVTALLLGFSLWATRKRGIR
jgi:hypothetical protein